MNRRLFAPLVALAALGVLLWAGTVLVGDLRRATLPGPVPSGGVSVEPGAPAAPPTTAAHPEIGFRTREKLVQHYQKHGREFGDISLEDYLCFAQELRDRPAGGEVLELRRGDGTISRFDRGSGRFVAFDRDLTLRTFFIPDDGEAYFRRQAARASRR